MSDSPMLHGACATCVKSVGAVNIGGNLALASIKGFLGVVGGSQALVADAIHSLADLLSSGLLTLGLCVADRPANRRHPYGYGKVEFLVALGIFVLLLSAGGFIFYDSVHMILHREEVNPSGITLFGAALSAVGNELMYRQSICAGHQINSPCMVANATEKRADVYSSLAVLAGITGAKLGVHVLDPLAAALVACLILHGSVKGIWGAFEGLTDSALDSDMLDRIEAVARKVPGVWDLGQFRSRELGQRVWVEFDVITDGRRTLEDLEDLRNQIARLAADCVGRPGEFIVHLRPRPAT